MFSLQHFGYILRFMLFNMGKLLYPLYFERFWYRIHEIEIAIPILPKAFDSFNIVHLSDVHLGHFFNNRNLIKLVQRVNRIQPDMIVFTGDLVEKTWDEWDQTTHILKQIQAPYGKFAVLGNHDYWENLNTLRSVYEDAGFTLLQNDHKRVYKRGEQLVVAGLDNILLGNPNLHKTMNGVTSDECIILLVHEPDYADQCVNFDPQPQLQLSGHSHGGQIRLPLWGHLILPEAAKKYPDRLYKLDSMNLYVNRGVGTTGIPLRLFCRPEISNIKLRSSSA